MINDVDLEMFEAVDAAAGDLTECEECGVEMFEVGYTLCPYCDGAIDSNPTEETWEEMMADRRRNAGL